MVKVTSIISLMRDPAHSFIPADAATNGHLRTNGSVFRSFPRPRGRAGRGTRSSSMSFRQHVLEFRQNALVQLRARANHLRERVAPSPRQAGVNHDPGIARV